MKDLFCPGHGRVDVGSLTFICSCEKKDAKCLKTHLPKNDVIEIFNKDRDKNAKIIEDKSDPKKFLHQISRCPNGGIVQMYCNICKNGTDISYILKKGNLSKQIITSFLGTTGSGKSNMIACLYKSIEKYTTSEGLSLIPLPQQLKKDFDDVYLKPLFPPNNNERRHCVKKTDTNEQYPFYFEVGQQHYIFFYDFPGEKLLDYTPFLKLHSVRESKCIVLLIPPESLNLEEYCRQKKGDNNYNYSHYDNSTISTNISSHFPDKKLKKLIIVMSKADNFFREGILNINPFETIKASEKVFKMYFEKPHDCNGKITIDYEWIKKYSDACKMFFIEVGKEVGLTQLINNAPIYADEVLCFVVSSFGSVGLKEEEGTVYLKGEPEMRQIDNIFYSIINN